MDNNTIDYQLQGIEIITKTLYEKPAVIDKLFLFELNINIRVRAQDKKVMPFIHVRVLNGDTKEIVGEIRVACIFEILEFEKYILLNSAGIYEIPKILEDHITPISISTTRGIMYSEFKGTYLHNAILPIITLNKEIAEVPKIAEAIKKENAKKVKVRVKKQ